MLAIGAFLGWGRVLYQHYKPFRPTRVQTALNLPAEIDSIRRQLGETDFSSFSTTSSGGGDSRSIALSYHYEFPLTEARYDQFADRLSEHVKSSIEASGCRVWGRGSGAFGGDIREIAFHYQRDVTVGFLRLIVLKRGNERGQILLFLDEHRESR
jgi:hypothetical protein